MSEVKPVAWMSDQGIPYKTESDARQNSWNNATPLYDKQTIELVISSRDHFVKLLERSDKKFANLKEDRDSWRRLAENEKIERDAAVADAVSLRERMLVLEAQRDHFHSEAFQSENARRKDAKDAGRWDELCRQIDLTIFPYAILDDAMAMGAGALELYIDESMKEQEQGK